MRRKGLGLVRPRAGTFREMDRTVSRDAVTDGIWVPDQLITWTDRKQLLVEGPVMRSAKSETIPNVIGTALRMIENVSGLYLPQAFD